MKIAEKLLLVKEMIVQLRLLDYSYFKNHWKMIAVDLSKQEALDADLKVVQQIDFTANLDSAGIQDSISFLKKQRNCVWVFRRNCKSFVSEYHKEV